MIKRIVTLTILAATMALSPAAERTASAEERSQVPEKLTWNLADLYPNDAAWEQAKDALEKRIPELAPYKGHLGDSSETFYKALSTMVGLDKDLARLMSYASQLADQDTRVSKSQGMMQGIEQTAAAYSAATAYLRPEILALGSEKVDHFVAADPKLKDFKPYLDNILRMKAHTLNPEGEKLMAQANGQMAGTPDSIYGIFTNADMPYPKDVKLPSGEVVPLLDAAAYTKYRASNNRADRDMVFKSFWAEYDKFKRTLGTSLYSVVKVHMFNKDARHYDSCLQAALDRNNVPTAVYTQLISDVHANLPTLHRYLKLRQRMMGVDQLRYEDLYASIVKDSDLKFTPEQAMDLTLKACAPLGKTYVDDLKKGYESRWVDFMPSTGKKSGAYSNGAAYDVHPYQLLNFMGGYDDVSTLAHESGHSMHSFLSNTHQPYITADYPIFVAEVASTLNENLLLHYMLAHEAKDDATKLFLLGSYLDGLRQTLFRQTLFAEFELKMHERAEAGDSLTGDNLTQMYLGLLKEYYGDAQGVCKVDDLYGVEWAYIPHFYYNFYVFQYATSLVASTSLANGIREEAAAKKPATKARDAYITMLSSGSSKYPIDLLKAAGVDMTTSAPFNAAMKEMNRTMDEIEAILNRQAASKAGKK